jgi:glyoxylase-like metal-dependent hydrolase (beta-lactamase superfamily II)
VKEPVIGPSEAARLERVSSHVWAFVPRDVATTECICYAIESADVLVLVDCGSGALWPDLFAALAHAGKPRAVAVFLTHVHIDHAGAVADVVRDGIPVYAHPGVFDALLRRPHKVWYEHPGEVKRPPADLLFRLFGEPRLQLGGIEIEVLATPGHTADHLSYLFAEPGGPVFAFSGDLVTPEGQPGWVGSEDFDEEKLAESIRKLLDRRPDMLLGGHWIMEDAAGKLQLALDTAAAGRWDLSLKRRPPSGTDP